MFMNGSARLNINSRLGHAFGGDPFFRKHYYISAIVDKKKYYIEMPPSTRKSNANNRPILKPIQHDDAPNPSKGRKLDGVLPPAELNDQMGTQANQRGAEGTFLLESSESLAENEKVTGGQASNQGEGRETQVVQKRKPAHRRTRSVHFED